MSPTDLPQVTYNYGVYEYDPGSGLLAIGVGCADPGAAVAAAAGLGYAVEGTTICGPDGYKYVAMPWSEADRAEPFSFIKLKVADVAAAVAWCVPHFHRVCLL